MYNAFPGGDRYNEEAAPDPVSASGKVCWVRGAAELILTGPVGIFLKRVQG